MQEGAITRKGSKKQTTQQLDFNCEEDLWLLLYLRTRSWAIVERSGAIHVNTGRAEPTAINRSQIIVR
eukprot:m.27667 g.27667  ORF g.27667 m.27667 type:complete len:68 (+) comp10303_c0_seq1:106-309(+)